MMQNVLGALIVILSIMLVLTISHGVVANLEKMSIAESYCTQLDMEYKHSGGGDNSICFGIESNKVIVKRLHFIDGIVYEESLHSEWDKE